MPTINIQIDPACPVEVDSNRLEHVARSALRACGQTRAEATIVLTSDEAVQRLNRQYRGVNAPTDVLSFEASPPGDEFPVAGEMAAYLGDIIIAAPTAARQARAAGHAPAEEILLLAVHGLLHLLGFDHLTPAGKDEMWQLQHKILKLNNLGHVTPTEEAH